MLAPYTSIRRVLPLGVLVASVTAWAQSPPPVAIADLREDIRGLDQRLADLSLRVEQLEHETAQIRTQERSRSEGGVTTVQLNAAIADLNAAIQSATASSKRETLDQVAAQMEKLARQTNAAIDSLAKVAGAGAPARVQAPPKSSPSVAEQPLADKTAAERPAPDSRTVPPAASYPKEGISYTVQKGDTVGSIAKKTGGRSQDIVAANRLADPSRIQVGQVLFVPGGH